MAGDEMGWIRGIRAALLWATLMPGLACAAEDGCPALLQKEAVAVRAPAGWQGYSASIMRLTGYGMMAGPPASLAYLVPGGSSKAKGRAASRWQFGAGGEKWLYCTYDGSAAIQISRRLPDGVTACELSHRAARDGVIEDMRVACR